MSSSPKRKPKHSSSIIKAVPIKGTLFEFAKRREFIKLIGKNEGEPEENHRKKYNFEVMDLIYKTSRDQAQKEIGYFRDTISRSKANNLSLISDSVSVRDNASLDIKESTLSPERLSPVKNELEALQKKFKIKSKMEMPENKKIERMCNDIRAFYLYKNRKLFGGRTKSPPPVSLDNYSQSAVKKIESPKRSLSISATKKINLSMTAKDTDKFNQTAYNGGLPMNEYQMLRRNNSLSKSQDSSVHMRMGGQNIISTLEEIPEKGANRPSLKDSQAFPPLRATIGNTSLDYDTIGHNRRAFLNSAKSSDVSYSRYQSNSMKNGYPKSREQPRVRTSRYSKLKDDVMHNLLNRVVENKHEKPERYNPQFLPPTPSVNDDLIKQPIRSFPNQREHLKNSIDLTEEQKRERSRIISKVIKQCEGVEKEGTKNIKKFDEQIQIEGIKQESFAATLDILKELEYADTNALEMLYFYKIKDIEEFKEVADEVSREYRSGMMDPCRDVAKFEKQAVVKKNVGKKHLINEQQKRKDNGTKQT